MIYNHNRETDAMQTKRYPMFGKLNAVFANWLQRRREIREIRELGHAELSDVARDLCITSTDLDMLVHKGAQAAVELPKLLNALGIDPAAIARSELVVLRDMVRVCAACEEKRRCDHDLSAGTSAQCYEEYCLNASTIDGLDRDSLIEPPPSRP